MNRITYNNLSNRIQPSEGVAVMEAMKRLTIQEKEQLRRDHESGRDICFEDGKAFAQECIADGDTEPDPWICVNVDASWVAGYITVFDAFKKAVNAGLINIHA